MTRPDILAAIRESQITPTASDTPDPYGVQEASCYRPGALWLDDQGHHINAHGAALLIHEGVWYWYGEHKTPVGDEAKVGVHVYVSDDGLTWRDGGVALAVSDDPLSDIRTGCIIERPKVIFCPKTQQFVMYAHLQRIGEKRYSGMSLVATANAPCGPFYYRHAYRPNAGVWPENVRPDQQEPIKDMAELRAIAFPGNDNPQTRQHNLLGRDFAGGQVAKDMTLFVDDDGTAYHIYSSKQNGTLHISRLTDDFLQSAGEYVRICERRWMEAPAIVKRRNRYYMIASDCTGWHPNAARGLVADHIFGPWQEIRNPCRGVNPINDMGPEKTWGTQSTYIQPLPVRDDMAIAMFDLWRPDQHNDGRYVWLPMVFDDDGTFHIAWHDTWHPDALPPEGG